jgi:hypothetical protein
MRLTREAAGALLVGVLCTGPAFAQNQARVSNRALLSADAPDLIHVEPHLAVHPLDRQRMLVGSIVIRDGRMSVDLLSSEGEGVKWLRTSFPPCMADPWVTFAPGGRAYLACVGHAERGQSQLIYSSVDDGRSWSGPVEVPRELASYDHSALVIDTIAEPQRVYVAGMIGRPGEPETAYVTWSEDGARTFRRVNTLAFTDVRANVSNPVVLATGEIGVALNEFATGADYRPLREPRIWWVGFDPRTRSFSTPRLVAEAAPHATPQVSVVKGSDGVERVLIPFNDRRAGRRGVYLASSDDGGKNWSEVRVLAREDSTASGFGTVVGTSDQSGRVAVAWYEQPAGTPAGCWRIRFISSDDGGVTFAPPATISTDVFCIHELEAGVQRRWFTAGEYFGLAPAQPGSFRIVWAESRSGAFQLHTAVVSAAR